MQTENILRNKYTY